MDPATVWFDDLSLITVIKGAQRRFIAPKPCEGRFHEPIDIPDILSYWTIRDFWLSFATANDGDEYAIESITPVVDRDLTWSHLRCAATGVPWVSAVAEVGRTQATL